MEFKKEEHMGTAGDQKDVVELQRPAEVSRKQTACSRRGERREVFSYA